MITNTDMVPGRYARWAHARRKLAWISEKIAAGYVVYLSTSTRSTKVTRKSLPQIKATQRGLLVKCQDKWIDYSYTKLRATLH